MLITILTSYLEVHGTYLKDVTVLVTILTSYLEVHGTYLKDVTVLVTISRLFRGLYVGCKYS